jgi:hypothetical protein
LLRSSEKLKLWLALAEDWTKEDGTKSEAFITARAAAGTLATAASDDDVVTAMIELKLADTLKALLVSENVELIHRAVVIIYEFASSNRKDAAYHLLENGVIPAMSSISSLSEELKSLAKESATKLFDIIKDTPEEVAKS